MNSLMIVFVFVVILACGVIILKAIVEFTSGTLFRSFFGKARRKRGQQMIRRATRSEFRFYLNIEKDIFAVCTKASFQEAFMRHMKDVSSGKVKEWEKVVCFAKPTFTFAGSEETKRPIHTGLRKHLELIVAEAVWQCTGISRKEVDLKDYNKAVSTIFVRDRRMFVPFSGNFIDPAEQIRLVGRPYLAEAIDKLKITKS